jgi:hypothetical protein
MAVLGYQIASKPAPWFDRCPDESDCSVRARPWIKAGCWSVWLTL